MRRCQRVIAGVMVCHGPVPLDERCRQDHQARQIHRHGDQQRNQKESIKKWARQSDLLLINRASSVRIATAMPLRGLAECSELLGFLAFAMNSRIAVGIISQWCGNLRWSVYLGESTLLSNSHCRVPLSPRKSKGDRHERDVYSFDARMARRMLIRQSGVLV